VPQRFHGCGAGDGPYGLLPVVSKAVKQARGRGGRDNGDLVFRFEMGEGGLGPGCQAVQHAPHAVGEIE